MNEPHGVDAVQDQTAYGAHVLGPDALVVACVGVHDAAAAGDHAVEAVLVEWFEKHENGPRPGNLLGVDHLFAAAELTSRNEVLDAGDHHRDDGPGLGCARGLGRHPDLHDLGF